MDGCVRRWVDGKIKYEVYTFYNEYAHMPLVAARCAHSSGVWRGTGRLATLRGAGFSAGVAATRAARRPSKCIMTQIKLPAVLLPLTVHYSSNAWLNRCEEIVFKVATRDVIAVRRLDTDGSQTVLATWNVSVQTTNKYLTFDILENTFIYIRQQTCYQCTVQKCP